MNKDVSALVERLEGIYRVPITDGLGAVGGGEEPENPNEFVRRFPTVPVQLEAASTIRALVAEIERLRDKRDEMSVEAARLFELHRQAEAKLREAVEVLHKWGNEFSGEHYHTCPADTGSGACNCYLGIGLYQPTFAFLATMEKTRD